ncbi:MAG TPA: myxosortase-dependent metalloprotease, MXAN_2677/MXAN_2678 family [Vulgatibacter sp.]|nr:myxosortase-dependent metalloprotease, MXAN_2677/MXAN_2678 family [Vulgatibacter sp.]
MGGHSERFAGAGWVVVALLALPAAARAYERTVVPGTDTCLFWNERSLGWALNQDGSLALGFEASHDAIARSFDTWQDVPCTDLGFADRSPTADVSIGFDRDGSNSNLLVFRQAPCVPGADPACDPENPCADPRGCWPYEPTVIALTTATFREKTGEILDADIEFNEADFVFTDVDGPPCGESATTSCVSTDLQNTATHEIGHFIGLDHSPDPDSTMFGSASTGEIDKRELAPDDEAGICDIYPRGGPTSVCSTSSGVRAVGASDGGCSCGQANGGSVAALLLAAIALARALRRLAGEAAPDGDPRGDRAPGASIGGAPRPPPGARRGRG